MLALRNVTKDAPLGIENDLIELLSSHSLEEAHIWKSGFGNTFVELLERQINLKALSVPNYIVNLKYMRKLEKLSILSDNGSQNEVLKMINSKSDRLTHLRAPLSLLSLLQRNDFPYLRGVDTVISSSADLPRKESSSDISSRRREERHLSSLASVSSAMTIQIDSSWDNTTLDLALCSDTALFSTTTTVTISTPENKVNFEWPSCFLNYTQVVELSVVNGPRVELSKLPLSISRLHITKAEISDATALVDILRHFPAGIRSLWLIQVPRKLSISPGDLSNCSAIHPGCLANLTVLFISNSTFLSTGLEPEWFFRELGATCPMLYEIRSSSNGWRGELPSDLFTNIFPNVELIELSHNQFVGSIPSLSNAVRGLYLSNNFLESWPSIPSQPTTSPLSVVWLANNALHTIPSRDSFRRMRLLVSLILSDNPNLTGELPAPWPTQEYIDTHSVSDIYLMIYWASNCAFNGTLPELPVFQTRLTSNGLNFMFSENRLTGTIPESWANFSFQSLALASNPGLHGSIPKRFGQYPSSSWLTLDLYNTSISGPLFNLQSANTRYSLNLRLHCSLVDTCSRALNPLPNGTAFASSCYISHLHSHCSTELIGGVSCSVINDTECRASLGQASNSCPGQHPLPLDKWKCIGNTWTVDGLELIDTPTITVRSSTVVNGNLSQLQQITFTGITGVRIEVTGCAQLPKKIVIVLTPTEYEQLRDGKKKVADLIHSSQCSFGATNGVQVEISGPKKRRTCEKIMASIVSKGQTVQGVFQIDKSACNRWWVILVAVLGAVLIVVIIVVIVFIVLNSRREKKAMRAIAK